MDFPLRTQSFLPFNYYLPDQRSIVCFSEFQKVKAIYYRVITKTVENRQLAKMKLASTSLQVGERIKAVIPAIEDVCVIRQGFGGDAKVVMFRYSAEPAGFLNIKVASSDLAVIMASINSVWQKVDRVHDLDAKSNDDQIQEACTRFSLMIKITGLFAFLAICIALLGLFGMVVFTTKTK